jgi:hypothetical protein
MKGEEYNKMEEFYNLYSSTNITRIITMKWTGHVACIGR